MTMLSQNVNQFGAMEAQQDVPQAEQQPPVNVGDTERLITGAVGGVLLLTALRRSLPGLLVAGIGGMLVHRAVSGHCFAYQAMGMDRGHV